MLETRGVTETCFVTHDLEKCIDNWVNTMGAGPFYMHTYGPGITLSYRGQPAHDSFKAAIGFSGATLIELLQPLNDAPSIFQEILQARGEGALHHVYPNIQPLSAAEFDAQLAAYRDKGFKEAAWLQPPGVGRNVFLDATDTLGCFIELLEFDPVTYSKITERLHAEHMRWDGKNPIRSMAELA